MKKQNKYFDYLILAILAALSLQLTNCTPENSSPYTKNRLIYLVNGETEDTQIWEMDWETHDTHKLSQLPSDILQYALSPDAYSIITPLPRTDGGQDLWIVQTDNGQAKLWLDCTPDDCTDPAWSPDRQSIIYTRITDNGPALWEADSETGTTHPFFSDSNIKAGYGSWSPNGEQLAYVDPEGQVCVYTLADADTQCIPAKMEAPPTWSPEGNILLVTDMRLGTGFVSHILRVDLQSNMLLDLSRSFNVEDDTPVWSPDGQWIAFRSRPAGAAMGKQIWLMQVNGTETYALTEEPEYYYGPPVWAANSKTLIVTRYSTEGTPTLWAISIETGTQEQLTSSGYRPQWVIK